MEHINPTLPPSMMGFQNKVHANIMENETVRDSESQSNASPGITLLCGRGFVSGFKPFLSQGIG